MNLGVGLQKSVELAQGLGFLDQMFEEMPVAMAILNETDTLVRFNPAFRTTFGYSSEVPLTTFVAHGTALSEGVKAVVDCQGRVRMVKLAIGQLPGPLEPYRLLTASPVDWGAMIPLDVNSLRKVVKSSTVGIWTRDDRTGRVLWSPELEEMVGYAPGQFPGTQEAFRDLVLPEDRPMVAKAVAEAESTRSDFDVDFRYLHQNGTVRWMKGVGRGNYDDNGRFVWMSGAGIDITDQVLAQASARESEERFRQVANAVPAVVWTTDPDGTNTFLNDRWYEYTGGQVFATHEERMGVVHPDDLESVTGALQDALATGKSFDAEARWRRSDGQYRWFLLRSEPVVAADGSIKCWCGTGIDIDDKRRAEELSFFHFRLTELLRAASSADQVLSAVIRELGSYLGASRCFYTDVNMEAGTLKVHDEYPRDGRSFVGEHSTQYIDASLLATLERRELLIINDTSEIEHSKTLRNFETAGIRAFVAVPVYEDGQLRHTLVVTHNTPREWTPAEVELVCEVCSRTWMTLQTKRAQGELQALNAELEHRVEQRTEELKAAYRDMEGFTYSVSHDLRAPLRAIMSSSMILLEDYGETLDPEAKQQLTRQAAAARQLGTLIDDLLSFSRLGRAEVAKKPVDLGRIVGELNSSIRSRHEKEAEIRVQPDLLVQADPTLIRMVMENLLDNAYKYSPRSGNLSIEVGAQEHAGERCFYVRDNGIGFDSQYADKLFQPFERLHRPDEYPGTGIGLANVKRIIERHGGRVWAEGVRDEGAVFFFTL